MKRFWLGLAVVLGVVGLVGAPAAAAPAHFITATTFVTVDEANALGGDGWQRVGPNGAVRTVIMRDYTNGNSACGGGYFCGWADADYYGNRGYWSTNWIATSKCMDLGAYGMWHVISSFNNQTGFFMRTWYDERCPTPLTGGTHDWMWGRGASHWVGSTYNDRAGGQFIA